VTGSLGYAILPAFLKPDRRRDDRATRGITPVPVHSQGEEIHMNVVRNIVFLCVLALVSATADAQTSTRVRGTITAFDGEELAVKSLEGKDLRVELAENTSISYPKALTLADLKPGVGLGTTATKRPDGTLVALEVHVFPPERGVPNEGHRPMDSQPGATMTNATVSAVVEAVNGRELTLTYTGGTQKLLVPEGIPIVILMPADRSLLQPGAYVSAVANVGADGKMTARFVQVSKDGVKPPL
jgi:Domain of unknown function (DUF5666)